MTTPTVPSKLRAAIAADLRPTRPLAPPARRSLVIVPLAIAILVGVPLFHRFRPDLAVLGVSRAWLLSIAQSVAGVGLVALAMREAIPGREIPRGRLTWAIAGGIVVPALVLAVTARVSMLGPSPDSNWWLESFSCFRVSALAAAPALMVSAALAARAYPLRPAIAGALYGLGSGLVADAGLRLWCEYSVPAHVLVAHGGAILASMFAGMIVATTVARVRR